MGKVPKVRKVYTPGSQPSTSGTTSGSKTSPGRGRPPKVRGSGKVMKKRGPRLLWPKDNMAKALAMVKSKQMTLGQAVEEYGIPKTTLFDRLHGSSGKLGRKPELSDEEEEILVSRPELGKVTQKTFH
jgi:helix-turn-helix, Psq domain